MDWTSSSKHSKPTWMLHCPGSLCWTANISAGRQRGAMADFVSSAWAYLWRLFHLNTYNRWTDWSALQTCYQFQSFPYCSHHSAIVLLPHISSACATADLICLIVIATLLFAIRRATDRREDQLIWSLFCMSNSICSFHGNWGIKAGWQASYCACFEVNWQT